MDLSTMQNSSLIKMSCSPVRTDDKKCLCCQEAFRKEQRCFKYSPPDFLTNILKEGSNTYVIKCFLSCLLAVC